MTRRLLTRFPLTVVTALLSGCLNVTWTGHEVPAGSWEKFVAHKTTKDQVVAVLGKPENIVHKPADGMTVYVYQYVQNMQAGLATIPFPVFFIGRARQSGMILSIFFSDDVFRGYELVELNQKLLWK
ncbi:hypothetical protein [Candidatus Nitrospira bockiana]